jgi:hypothetical protein
MNKFGVSGNRSRNPQTIDVKEYAGFSRFHRTSDIPIQLRKNEIVKKQVLGTGQFSIRQREERTSPKPVPTGSDRFPEPLGTTGSNRFPFTRGEPVWEPLVSAEYELA